MNIVKNLTFKSRRKEELQSIYSIEVFHTILKRERFRTDRNYHGFSLIVFNVKGPGKDIVLAKRLEEILISRVRISDEVGWFDEQRIAVLLPDTSSKNARKLADMVCMEFEATATVPSFNIYSYPSQKWFKENENTELFHITDDLYPKVAVGHKMPLWKRATDITLSFIGLLILTPLFMLVGILIKTVSPGPVFFMQNRVGHSGKIFKLFKFRTMKVNNDATEHKQHLKELINGDSNGNKPMMKLDNDSRIIPLGNIIRKTCIDELPQLINVFLGDMSLVGPRPCIPYEAEEYLRWHARRFDITPGMTGLWQVSGKNKTTFMEMIRYDINYAAARSFKLDTIILFKTPLVVLLQIMEDTLKMKRNGSPDRKKVLRAAEIA